MRHAAGVSGSARERFLALAAGPEAGIDLAEATLWIAAEARPGLDVAAYLARLAALSTRAARAIDASRPLAERVARLNAFLFEQEGFRGNRDAYYDPRNSYLCDVLDRRTGIPITLAIVWIEVARRLGIDAHGVGFPGHFLALARGAVSGEADVLVDAFGGRVIDRAECRALLARALGPDARLDPRLLAPAPAREILARVLRNLKQIHVSRAEAQAALGCAERLVALRPDDPVERRDRGLLYRALGFPLPALTDLEDYLRATPQAPDAADLRRTITELRHRLGPLH